MTERIVLRCKCDRGKHTPVKVLATVRGFEVRLDEVVLTGYGNRFETIERAYPIDGPAEDPEAWATFVGCVCGHQFTVNSSDLRAAIAQGVQVLTLPVWRGAS